jgi:hypothetical protein
LQPPPARVALLAFLVERERGLGIEEVDLLQRDLQREVVTGLEAVLAADEGDDVVPTDAEVDELLVAEVLDDVSGAAERARRSLGIDVEVLRANAHGELVAAEALMELLYRSGSGMSMPSPTSLISPPSRRTSTSRKFMAGLPMKPATKRLSGWS